MVDKIKKDHFSGTGKVHGTNPGALAGVVRGISRSLAIQRVGVKTVALTDNTGGTAEAAIEDVTVTPTQTLINNNFASINAKLDALIAIVGSGPADVADDSGGTADTTDFQILSILDALLNVVEVGTTLTQVAAFNTQVTKIENAFTTLLASAAVIAATLGIDSVTDSGGGTDGSGTIASMAATGTAATTGVVKDDWNVSVAELRVHQYITAIMINRIAVACGKQTLALPTGKPLSVYVGTIPVYTDHATHSAADPAVLQTVTNAMLADFRTNVATMAAVLNGCTGGVDWPINVIADA